MVGQLYGFIVSSQQDHETEESAWECFDSNLENMLYWVRGYKYWRRTPHLETVKDFESNRVIYRVAARVIASEAKIPGVTEIVLGRPYSSELPKSEIEDGEHKLFGL